MRAFVLWSHALLAVAAIPLTGLLAFWALMAESGGKNSHPEVLVPMLWGIAELIWTLVVAVRNRRLPSPTARWRRAVLAAGLALTLVGSPVTLMATALDTTPRGQDPTTFAGMLTTFAGGPERALIFPYVLLAFGCRIMRVGLVGHR